MVSLYYRFIILSIVAIFSMGCSGNSYFKSKNTLKSINFDRDDMLVDDITYFLQKYVAPAKTILYIDSSKMHTNIPFTRNLENRLREVGYGISRKYIYAQTIPFAWQVDRVGDGIIRATYLLSGSKISRLYKMYKGRYVAFTPFTTMGLGSPRYRVKKLSKRSVKHKRKRKSLSYKDYKVKKNQQKPQEVDRIGRGKRRGFKNKINSPEYQNRWRHKRG